MVHGCHIYKIHKNKYLKKTKNKTKKKKLKEKAIAIKKYLGESFCLWPFVGFLLEGN